MRHFIYISLLVLYGCSNVKTIYTEGELYPNSYPIKQMFEKFDAKGLDKSVIVFTGWFEKDIIKIVNGNNVIFDEPVETNPQTGFSVFKVASNEEIIEIQVLTDKLFKISLKQEDLKKYKFVYISRDAFKRDKYGIEYSNNWKKFM
jgi:hypothetical protein